MELATKLGERGIKSDTNLWKRKCGNIGTLPGDQYWDKWINYRYHANKTHMIILFIEWLSPWYSSSKKLQLSWQLKRLSYPCFDACVSKTSIWRAMYVTLTFPSITTRSETLEVWTCNTKRWSWVGVYWDQARICSSNRLPSFTAEHILSRLMFTGRGGTSPPCCTSVLVNHIQNPFPPQMYLCHGNVILALFIDHVTQLSI